MGTRNWSALRSRAHTFQPGQRHPGMRQYQVTGCNRIEQTDVESLPDAADDNVSRSVIADRLNFRYPSLVGTGHANLVRAENLGIEEAGVLEHNVGEFPQQVVEQYHLT